MKKETLLLDPFAQFEQCYEKAKARDEDDLDAMALATASAQGRPSVRVVLYKGFNKEGFLIYTNYNSRKAEELNENPYAALSFYWPKSYQQVRIEGKVEKLTLEESNEYFQTRPRDSQLSAWASAQSKAIDSREQLESKFKKIEAKFANKPIPCPDFWGGYCLKPSMIEFWQGQKHRLHDRFRYTLRSRKWVIEILAP